MPEVSKALLLAVVLCAGIYDVRVRRIPNWLTLPAVLFGLILNSLLVHRGLLLALGGIGCALLVYFPLYLVRGMGAGDVKLMAAVGAICGPSNWLLIFLGTALIAGGASIVAVVLKRRFIETAHNLDFIITSLLRAKSPSQVDPSISIENSRALRMPHGAFIASGAMLFLAMTRS